MEICDYTDFPSFGQTLRELVLQGDKAAPKKPANESLVKTFKRCHDYIYGNEGMKKTAFVNFLNLIFYKLYDEECDVVKKVDRCVGVHRIHLKDGRVAFSKMKFFTMIIS